MWIVRAARCNCPSSRSAEGVGRGALQSEVAEWLVKRGAWSGLILDGGGSSSLLVEGEGGQPRILYGPIQAGVPGRERPCPNHLEIFAVRLK